MTINELKQSQEVPVVVTNAQGNFTFVNEKFSEVFGWGEHEAIGQNMVMIIPPDLRDAHNMGLSRFLSTETGTILEQKVVLKACNKNEEIFDANHFIVAEKIDNEWFFAATIDPV